MNKKSAAAVIFIVIAAAASASVFFFNNKLDYMEVHRLLMKEYAGVNQLLAEEYKENNKIIADYEDAEKLIENFFKKHMDITDRPIKFTNRVCKNGRGFQKKDGVIYCIDEDVFYIDKKDRQTGACGKYNNKACNKDLSNDTVTIWIDINGKKGPNKISTLERDYSACRRTEEGLMNCEYKGTLGDIFGFVLYGSRMVPAAPYTQAVVWNQ